jgi:hypothetical protein
VHVPPFREAGVPALVHVVHCVAVPLARLGTELAPSAKEAFGVYSVMPEVDLDGARVRSRARRIRTVAPSSSTHLDLVAGSRSEVRTDQLEANLVGRDM